MLQLQKPYKAISHSARRHLNATQIILISQNVFSKFFKGVLYFYAHRIELLCAGGVSDEEAVA